MAIKTRETTGTGVTNKGAPLTNAELDNNFIELVADISGKLSSYTETDPVVGAVNGIVKADGAGNISAATAGTDYLTSYTETDPVVGAVNGIVKADGAGNISAATAGTDYLASETFTELSQDTSPQLGGTLDANGNSVSLKGITETQATKSASFTPNLTTDGTIFNCSGTMTITMPTAAAGKSFTVIHSSGSSITWSGTILWNGGTAPTAAAAKEIYVFLSDGTNWYGNQAGTGYA